jgi:membrane-bound inhibitor of C-type lysozyme
MRLILLALAAAALASCAAKGDQPAAAPAAPSGSAAAPAPAIAGRAVFLCDNGVRMTALFEESATPQSARVTLTFTDNAVLVLPRQAAASGFRYADAANALEGKGAEVRFTAANAAPTLCTDVSNVK